MAWMLRMLVMFSSGFFSNTSRSAVLPLAKVPKSLSIPRASEAVPSMTVAWLSTGTCAVAAPVNNSAAARIKRVVAPFIWIPPPLETVSQLTRAGQKKNSFEKQKHNSIQQRYAKVGGKERGSDGVPIRESRAVRAVTGEYRRLREPGRSSTGL